MTEPPPSAPPALTALSAPSWPFAPPAWEALQVYPWVAAMRGCPQSPVHHAEGDVWIHTGMVLEALAAMPSWRALPDRDRWITWLACLLHDVGKPATTVTEPDGRITSRGHSRVGDRLARRLLWALGAPFAVREEVCALVRYHQIPFFLVDAEPARARHTALELAEVCRARLLAIVAEADILGRICADTARVVDNIRLFELLCDDFGCLEGLYAFPSDHTRVTYLRSPPGARAPDVPVYDDTRAEMVMLSGLPGAGKDTWVAAHAPDLPAVSLDGLRLELGVAPDADQGAVRQLGAERMRAHLRRGEPFVHLATNLDRTRRAPLLALAADYRYRVRIVYVEVPRAVLLAQNRARDAAVPERVIDRMCDRWEVPTTHEAHAVDLAVRDLAVRDLAVRELTP